MSTVSREHEGASGRRKPGPRALPPSSRNCAIYERVQIEGESGERVAADCALSRQRIAEIVASVETWIARHSEHPLARKMRLRCGQRWDALWSRSIESFDRSREDREVKKERVGRRAVAGGNESPTTTITERTVRQQNGDPRFLTIAARIAEREDRLWIERKDDEPEDGLPSPSSTEGREMACSREAAGLGRPCSQAEFPYLPAALRDLELLACGLRNGTESVPYRNGDALTPVATLFEQRCAEAFRCLGFEVRELGQGCGRVADCLAIAAPERFAAIIDAKVRRRGYTLGTDDRQFCEYATRHTRELALSGIDKVYFAVVGRGFRQDDLTRLTAFMTGTPIRSVCFLEARALMRLVDRSIHKRREFRLADIDQLLFGNKIINEEVLGLRS